MKLHDILIAGGAILTVGSIVMLNVECHKEHTARLAAEAKVQTVSEYVKTRMQDKQTRAILCSK